MFSNLANAIAFEVGFRASTWYASSAHDTMNDEARRLRAKYILDEVEELRTNSDLPVDSRAISSDILGTAVAFKTQMYIDCVRGSMSRAIEYFIVFINTPKVATGVFKRARYSAYHHAANAARKANQFCSKPNYEVIDSTCRLRRLRLVLVRSSRDGALVLERNDTPFTSSVASESYWQN